MSPKSESKTTSAQIQIAGVRFQPTGKAYHFDATNHPDLQAGDFVLVETSRGKQLGEVVGLRPMDKDEIQDLKPIKRRATGRDLALLQHWREKEAETLAAAREEAAQLNLPAKIITAEYTFDGQRLTLLYVSEDKNPDFGRLLQRLRKITRSRVDMRRVGVRDHAKLMGGYGACGEPRCCARFLSDFNPVSIKMAKTQGVSLNPSEITGMCGRLRCCLVYEDEQYRDACKMMPRRKKRVQTPHGEGRVVDLLPLRGAVVVQIEDRRIEVPVEEVETI
ncbi:MAG: stage 0 sporulation protein [Anaerolineae bacterium]|nr:stage 0 sporulation protein [Anaerolineae bacterium]